MSTGSAYLNSVLLHLDLKEHPYGVKDFRQELKRIAVAVRRRGFWNVQNEPRLARDPSDAGREIPAPNLKEARGQEPQVRLRRPQLHQGSCASTLGAFSRVGRRRRANF